MMPPTARTEAGPPTIGGPVDLKPLVAELQGSCVGRTNTHAHNDQKVTAVRSCGQSPPARTHAFTTSPCWSSARRVLTQSASCDLNLPSSSILDTVFGHASKSRLNWATSVIGCALQYLHDITTFHASHATKLSWFLPYTVNQTRTLESHSSPPRSHAQKRRLACRFEKAPRWLCARHTVSRRQAQR